MKKVILLVLVIATSVMSVNFTYATYSSPGYQTTDLSVVINGQAVSSVVHPMVIDGSIMVPAKAVFKSLGVNVNWIPGSTKIIMSIDGVNISMRLGDRSVIVNGIRKKLDAPPVIVDGAVMVPVKQLSEYLNAQVSISSNEINIENVYKKMKTIGGRAVPYVVVVDAGHGGEDPGAVFNGVQEKDLNLDIAKRLNQLLENKGIKTYMTRTDDTFIDLYDRSGLANRVNADLLISIHNNYSERLSASGSMSLYNPGTSNFNGGLTADGFAAIVQKELIGELSTFDWGEFERPELAVLRTAKMPAVIAEVGFMTNSYELWKLRDPNYRQDAAEALKNAVLKALDKI